MYSFEKLPNDARIWIYAPNRTLTETDLAVIETQSKGFLQSWTAHDIPVDATFDVMHNYFLVFAVNEHTSDISGCGIDKSFAFVKQLGASLGIDFFNRLQIEVKKDGVIEIHSKAEIKELLADGRLTERHTTFNKTITRKSELFEEFEIPIASAWFYPSIKQSLVTE